MPVKKPKKPRPQKKKPRSVGGKPPGPDGKPEPKKQLKDGKPPKGPKKGRKKR
jgi:hypothetical protein